MEQKAMKQEETSGKVSVIKQFKLFNSDSEEQKTSPKNKFGHFFQRFTMSGKTNPSQVNAAQSIQEVLATMQSADLQVRYVYYRLDGDTWSDDASFEGPKQ
jgi:hypothetical protein